MFAAFDGQRPAALPLLFPRPVAIAFGIVVLIVWTATAFYGIRTRAPAAIRYAFCSGAVATLVSGIFGFDPPIGIGLGIGIAGFGLGSIRLSEAGPETARACVRAFLWSALLACVVALAMLATHRPNALYEFDNARAVGTFLNPNELAAYAVVALGVSLPLAIFGRDRLAIVTSALLLVTLALTFSRWGMLSAVFAAFAFAFAIGSRRVALAILAVAIAATGFNYALGSTHHNPVDNEMRDAGWQAGWNTFVQFPLLGVGPLSFSKTYQLERPPDGPGPDHPVAFDPHSVPLSFAASGGMLAVVVMFSSAWILQRRAYDAGRASSGLSRMLALGIVCSVLGLMFDALTNTVSLIFPLGYQSLALALAVAKSKAVS